jgi:hypothetical protein
MRMTTVGRKLIACWPETDVEGGFESTSRGDTRKDWQQTVGGKVGAEETGGALRTGGESLSETPRAAPTQSAKQPTNQNKQNRKNDGGTEAREEGDRRSGTQEGKKGIREGDEASHKSQGASSKLPSTKG